MSVVYASNKSKCIMHFSGTEPEPPGIPNNIKIEETMTRHASKGIVKTQIPQGSKELSGVPSKMKLTRVVTTKAKIQTA